MAIRRDSIFGGNLTTSGARETDSANFYDTGTRQPEKQVPKPIENNIQQLIERQKQEQGKRTLAIRISDAITAFSGSILFLGIHVLWFAGWIFLNVGLFSSVGEFDPFPFGLLTMVVSLEAIFLSTFVLISQNRMQAAADRRAELDLHVNLLAEHEATAILQKLTRIEARLGIAVSETEERKVDELVRETNPVHIAEEIERKVEEEVEEQVAGQIEERVTEEIDEQIDERVERRVREKVGPGAADEERSKLSA
jgi:uncharacterized membrane protein